MKIFKHILAIDPGKLMGVCRFITEAEQPTKIVEGFEIPGGIQHCMWVFKEWRNGYPFVPDSERLVIVEDWDYRDNQFAVDARLAVEPMAWFKMLGMQHGIKVITQRPQVRMQITEEVLKDSGYRLKGGAGHKRQASRHGLSYIVRNLHQPTMEKLYGAHSAS